MCSLPNLNMIYLTSTLFQIPKCGGGNDGSVERISADAKLPEGSR